MPGAWGAFGMLALPDFGRAVRRLQTDDMGTSHQGVCGHVSLKSQLSALG